MSTDKPSAAANEVAAQDSKQDPNQTYSRESGLTKVEPGTPTTLDSERVGNVGVQEQVPSDQDGGSAAQAATGFRVKWCYGPAQSNEDAAPRRVWTEESESTAPGEYAEVSADQFAVFNAVCALLSGIELIQFVTSDGANAIYGE